MGKNELITLSSDEEGETADQLMPKSDPSQGKEVSKLKIVQSSQKQCNIVYACEKVHPNFSNQGSNCFKKVPFLSASKSKDNTNTVEVVDLEGEDGDLMTDNDLESKTPVKDASSVKDQPEVFCTQILRQGLPKNVREVLSEKCNETESNFKDVKVENKSFVRNKENLQLANAENSKFFSEFVSFCGSLEDDKECRERLMKKLEKRFEEADKHYVQSEELKNLIEKSRRKLSRNNLYLIALEVSDELASNKKLIQKSSKSVEIEKDRIEEIKKGEKNNVLIQKIQRKLDVLGMKIRKLEEEEVDLSDENSSYICLQKYRQRFVVIFEKFCKLTKRRSYAGRVSFRKFRFNESNYPAINRCIEKWLNETKKFPDFADVVKLLESQSSSLGLPSDKDSLRDVASKIFKKVGEKLQRRRQCDLWYSLSGFLETSEDPSTKHPELKSRLKENFEEGKKKEKEIINFFAEKQEKDHIEPEEVPEEEADNSPIGSNSEDDSDVEEIEEFIEEKVNDEKNTEKIQKDKIKKEEHALESPSTKAVTDESKSKNNYKNCKSLEWRNKNESKRRESENNENSKRSSNVCLGESSKVVGQSCEIDVLGQPRKRVCLTPVITKVETLIETENPQKKKKVIEVFDVFSCQTKQTYDAFRKLEFLDEFCMKKKERSKERIFKDLTNIKGGEEITRRGKNDVGLFSYSIFSRKSLWRSRRNVNIKFSKTKVQKCASNHDDESGKNVRRDSENSEEKEYSNNSEGGEEGSNYFSGNGNEEDNNDDENRKKNEKIDDEENQNEEDDEEQEKEEENESEDKLHSKISSPKMEETGKIDCEEEFLKDTSKNVGKKDIEKEREVVGEEATEESKRDVQDEKLKDEEEKEEEISKVVENGELKFEKGESPVGKDGESSKIKNVDEKEENKTEKVKSVHLEERECSEERAKAVFVEKLELNPNKFKTPSAPRRNSHESGVSSKVPQTQSFVQSQKLYEVETIVQRMRQQISKQSPSDEERVKRFLLNSPSSISITPPKKLQCKNPPSQEALQALETLKNLKGISATRVVRGKPKNEEDVVVIGESSSRRLSQGPHPQLHPPPKQRRFDLPVIANVHSMKPSRPRFTPPPITQPRFFNNYYNHNNGQYPHNPSSIRISNVWGSLPSRVYQSLNNNNSNNRVSAPGCSFRQGSPTSSNNNNLASRKKINKKPVEYVVLD